MNFEPDPRILVLKHQKYLEKSSICDHVTPSQLNCIKKNAENNFFSTFLSFWTVEVIGPIFNLSPHPAFKSIDNYLQIAYPQNFFKVHLMLGRAREGRGSALLRMALIYYKITRLNWLMNCLHFERSYLEGGIWETRISNHEY